jgi:hypothetical protein
MHALLDQAVVGEAASVADALEAARQHAASRGRVIVEVKLDGVPLSNEQLDAPETAPAGAKLECISADPRALVGQSFLQAADALDEARVLQGDAAGALMAGKVEEAFASLTEVISVWESVRRVVEQGPALVGVQAEELCPPGTDFAARTMQLGTALSAMKGSMVAQDWAGLADLLQVEMDEQAGVWTELLGAMGRFAAGRSAGGQGNA